jgi:hypothetical protein
VESSDIEHDEPQIDQEEDIWGFGDSIEPQGKEIIHRSWDTFGDNAGGEPCSAYISEGRPEVFDAALRLQSRNTSGKDTPSSVVQYRLLINVCYQLAN